MDRICCVYKLTNTQTGKFYIGSTVNLKARLKYHRYSHQHNPNKELANAIDVYGWESFKVEIVEICSPENVRERERHYIVTLNAVELGYNQTNATTYRDWMTGYNAKMWKDEEYRKLRSKQSSDVQKRRLQNPDYLKEKSNQLKSYTDTLKKRIGMYTKDGELLRTFNGVREAERWLLENGFTKSTHASAAISDCAIGGRHKTVYGYVWRYL